MKKKSRILFVCYGSAHINMILPLYKYLFEKSEPVILALTTAQRVLDREGISYLGFKDFIDDKRSLEKGRELVESLPCSNLVDQRETIAYMGMSYMDLEDRIGNVEALELFRQQGRYCFYPLSVADKVLDRVKPDMVIATSSPRMEKAIMTKARERGLLSLCLINLFDIKEAKDRSKFSGYGSKICVESSYTRNRLIDQGRPAEEIELTGSPAFDYLSQPEPQEVVDSFMRSKKIQGSKNILWVRIGGDIYKSMNEEIDTELVSIARENKDWNIIFRPHPNDEVSFSNLPSNVFISTRADNLKLLLQASSVVITINSTLGIEAAILGKRVMQFLDNPLYQSNPLVERKMAIGIPKISELENVIREQLENKDPVQVDIPSHATERIAKLCLSMLGER